MTAQQFERVPENSSNPPGQPEQLRLVGGLGLIATRSADDLFPGPAEYTRPKYGADVMGEDLAVDDLDVPAPTTDGIKQFLRTIGRIPLLTAEQEISLAKDIEAGLYAKKLLGDPYALGEYSMSQSDEQVDLPAELAEIGRTGDDAKQHFIEANLRLVVSIAKLYRGRGLEFLDLIQEGSLGLNKAVDKFDYTRGNKFSTHASWWIRQSIGYAVSQKGRTIRIAAAVKIQVDAATRAQRELSALSGRRPTVAETAHHMGQTEPKVQELLGWGQLPIYFDKLVGEEGVDTLGGLIKDPGFAAEFEQVELSLLRRDLLDVLAHSLTKNEAEVVALRAGLVDGRPWTLQQIAEHPNQHSTRQTIRQRHISAMKKLQDPIILAKLRDYLT
ncbi:MAG: sigma-70 family RNA polymerase sigma factor [Candidatus Saccharibacteria bacterium]